MGTKKHSENQKVVSNPTFFAQNSKPENMDFFRIKKILLDEYLAAGGRNEKDFVHGMNYIIDYIEENRQSEPLNDSVDDLICLKLKIKRLEKELEEKETVIKDKNNIIRNFREMRKDERAKFRKSEELMKLEQTYSRMILALHQRN